MIQREKECEACVLISLSTKRSNYDKTLFLDSYRSRKQTRYSDDVGVVAAFPRSKSPHDFFFSSPSCAYRCVTIVTQIVTVWRSCVTIEIFFCFANMPGSWCVFFFLYIPRTRFHDMRATVFSLVVHRYAY